jgi:hypothetical protein
MPINISDIKYCYKDEKENKTYYLEQRCIPIILKSVCKWEEKEKKGD